MKCLICCLLCAVCLASASLLRAQPLTISATVFLTVKKCAFLLICVIIEIAGVRICSAQNRAIDSLNAIVRTSTNDSVRMRVLLSLVHFVEHRNPRQLESYATEALALAQKIRDTASLVDSYCFLSISAENKNLQTQAWNYSHLALAAAQLSNNASLLSTAYNQCSELFRVSLRYDSAIISAERAMAYALRASDTVRYARANGNLAQVYVRQGRYAEAAAIFERIAPVFVRFEEEADYLITLARRGYMLGLQGEYEKELPFYEKVQDISRQSNSLRYMMDAALSTGQALFHLKRYNEALPHLQSSLLMSDSLEIEASKEESNLYLSRVYEAMGKPTEALYCYKQLVKSILTRESVNSDKIDVFEIMRSERLLKEKEMLIAEREAANVKLRYVALAVTVVVLLLLVIAAIVAWRLATNKRSLELEIKNTELHESLETLRRTQNQLLQAEKMASLGTLVAGVAHELNTPIGVAVTAASTLHVRTHDFAKRYAEGALKKSELEGYVQTAKTGADLTLRNLERAANLIQSFKQVSVDQTYDNIRHFRVKQYLHEIITSLQPKWKTTGHRVEIECDETLEMETYAGAIAQIITNFVTNSLLHGFEGFTEEGVMRIEAERVGDNVVLKYSDNGRGIPPEILPRIFDPFFTTKQANGGTGLGMHIVYNLVTQKLGGSIRCESAYGDGLPSGTTFIVDLPSQRVQH